MRGVWLYLRSRRIAAALLGLSAVDIIALVAGARLVQPRESNDLVVPWLLFLPMLGACITAMSVRSSMHDLDLTGARRLGPIRLAHVGLFMVMVGGVLAVLGAQLDGPMSVTAVVRNLIGLTGLALLGGRLLGGRLAWIAPVVWTACATTLGDPRSTLPPWDWQLRYDSDVGALVAAGVLFGAGMVAAVTGTREARAEAE